MILVGLEPMVSGLRDAVERSYDPQDRVDLDFKLLCEFCWWPYVEIAIQEGCRLQVGL
jgi:hypothetical protein